jgi:hypothetical protein
MKLHEPTEPWEPIILTQGASGRVLTPSMPLEVAVIYQDTFTREWIRQTCAHVSGQVPAVPMQSSWWKIDCLEDPNILQGAIKATARAEVIMVGVYALETVPYSLLQWHEGWIERREREEGVLLAMIGTPKPPAADASVMRNYFKDIANRAGLHFMSRLRPLETPERELSPGKLSMLAPVGHWVPSRYPTRVSGYHDDWGINE